MNSSFSESCQLRNPCFGSVIILEVPAFRSRHLPPQDALFDPFLEQNKALKRHRNGVFHSKFLQTPHHRVAEKGAVHAYLQSRRAGRRSRTALTQAVTNSTEPLESCTLPLRCNTSST